MSTQKCHLLWNATLMSITKFDGRQTYFCVEHGGVFSEMTKPKWPSHVVFCAERSVSRITSSHWFTLLTFNPNRPYGNFCWCELRRTCRICGTKAPVKREIPVTKYSCGRRKWRSFFLVQVICLVSVSRLLIYVLIMTAGLPSQNIVAWTTSLRNGLPSPLPAPLPQSPPPLRSLFFFFY